MNECAVERSSPLDQVLNEFTTTRLGLLGLFIGSNGLEMEKKKKQNQNRCVRN